MIFSSWERFKGSFFYAWSGLWRSLVTEQNLWIMLVVGILVMFLAWYYQLEFNKELILLLFVTSTIAAEILNTLVEFTLDRFHPSNDLDVKIIKDMMAGFVLLWSIVSLVVGIIIFWPHIF